MIHHESAFYKYGSHQNFQKFGLNGLISRKLLNQNILKKSKLNRNLRRIYFKMMYTSVSYSVKVCIAIIFDVGSFKKTLSAMSISRK